MDGPVLLTGASGLLGGRLLAAAPDDVEVVALTHRTAVAATPSVVADLRDPEATRQAVRQAAPSLVLHAAYVVDEASIVAATAHVVAAAAEVGAPVVLTSTDAVFAGDGVVRTEADTPDPVFDYGRWKAAAERLVLAGAAGSAVARLPLLVSIDPDDHVVRQIRAAVAGGEPSSWFDDEIRRPALAAEVAGALWRIAALASAERAGVWHLLGPERLSRLQIARRVAARLGVPTGAVTGGPTPPGLVRPRDLELSDRRARRAVGWAPSPMLA